MKKTETPDVYEMPAPPDWLDAEAKRQYLSAAEMLTRAGTIRPADAPLLVAYAVAMADYVELSLALRASGHTVVGAHGGQVVNPLSTMKAIAHRQLLSACRSLGMTPTDKSRVKREPVKAKNPFLQK